MLATYRRLAELRREWPELTDPAFDRTRCTVDEEARLFTMRRGSLVVVVNFGSGEASWEVDGVSRVLFETEAGVALADSVVTVPAHAGALLAP